MKELFKKPIFYILTIILIGASLIMYYIVNNAPNEKETNKNKQQQNEDINSNKDDSYDDEPVVATQDLKIYYVEVNDNTICNSDEPPYNDGFCFQYGNVIMLNNTDKVKIIVKSKDDTVVAEDIDTTTLGEEENTFAIAQYLNNDATFDMRIYKLGDYDAYTDANDNALALTAVKSFANDEVSTLPVLAKLQLCNSNDEDNSNDCPTQTTYLVCNNSNCTTIDQFKSFLITNFNVTESYALALIDEYKDSDFLKVENNQLSFEYPYGIGYLDIITNYTVYKSYKSNDNYVFILEGVHPDLSDSTFYDIFHFKKVNNKFVVDKHFALYDKIIE